MGSFVSEAIGREGFGISLTTDKITYRKGEPITLTLRVFNHTQEQMILHFRDAQRYDFIIADRKGNEVWRWSKGRIFAQVLGEEIIKPEGGELNYRETVTEFLSPGQYMVMGTVVAEEGVLSTKIVINVK